MESVLLLNVDRIRDLVRNVVFEWSSDILEVCGIQGSGRTGDEGISSSRMRVRQKSGSRHWYAWRRRERDVEGNGRVFEACMFLNEISIKVEYRNLQFTYPCS
jgi:hypothetical protein